MFLLPVLEKNQVRSDCLCYETQNSSYFLQGLADASLLGLADGATKTRQLHCEGRRCVIDLDLALKWVLAFRSAAHLPWQSSFYKHLWGASGLLQAMTPCLIIFGVKQNNKDAICWYQARPLLRQFSWQHGKVYLHQLKIVIIPWIQHLMLSTEDRHSLGSCMKFLF